MRDRACIILNRAKDQRVGQDRIQHELPSTGDPFPLQVSSAGIQPTFSSNRELLGWKEGNLERVTL